MTQHDMEKAMDNHTKNIFVIDDEESIRKVLNTHLTKEGYGVVQSDGGNGIFNMLKSNSIDLVICDIKMPEIDGTQILEFVRQNFDTIPVIMLTGFVDTSIAIEVMKKGAFDYLMKPIKKDDLMSTIQKALAHRDLLVKNKELERENKEYQLSLEQKVRERTMELNSKATELQKANEILKTMNIQFINILAGTIEAKDHYTKGHCDRIRCMCVALGKLAGFSQKEMETLEYASLLHDLGKISIDETVLNKKGVLDEDELMRMKMHSVIGEKILQDGIPLMGDVGKIIAAHHENFDGSGYPNNLKEGEIPISSRIIAVADVYDAMSTDRPYREGLPLERILKELERVAGTQLDPEIVRLFIENEVYLAGK